MSHIKEINDHGYWNTVIIFQQTIEREAIKFGIQIRKLLASEMDVSSFPLYIKATGLSAIIRQKSHILENCSISVNNKILT